MRDDGNKSGTSNRRCGQLEFPSEFEHVTETLTDEHVFGRLAELSIQNAGIHTFWRNKENTAWVIQYRVKRRPKVWEDSELIQRIHTPADRDPVPF